MDKRSNPVDKRTEIRLAGEGGQGMILAGIILAEAAAIVGFFQGAFAEGAGDTQGKQMRAMRHKGKCQPPRSGRDGCAYYMFNKFTFNVNFINMRENRQDPPWKTAPHA